MKLNRADLTSLFALIISMSALFVSIFEAKIMKDQQEIMQTQQKASVFPYLTRQYNFNALEKSSFEYIIENKGIGPAKIKKAVLYVDGKEIKTNDDLRAVFKKVVPEDINFSLATFNPENYFISPKEKVNLISVKYNSTSLSIFDLQSLKIDYQICYCSLFDDCWMISENTENGNPKCD